MVNTGVSIQDTVKGSVRSIRGFLYTGHSEGVSMVNTGVSIQDTVKGSQWSIRGFLYRTQ